MISWTFDYSGKLEDVIEHIKTIELSRSQREHVALVEESGHELLRELTEKQRAELLRGLSTEALNDLIVEHLGDYERVRRLILDELHICRFPFAGVIACWEDAPPHLGGYGLRLHVSGYENDPQTAHETRKR